MGDHKGTTVFVCGCVLGYEIQGLRILFSVLMALKCPLEQLVLVR